ncbi:MAG: UDP-N-acetylmuramate--L-alanine ligase, partial [Parcubacteria group bacterium]|nr:UDP-N-acetylmuramate--L-alanine ligase [Parcubacteria group bacterium]
GTWRRFEYKGKTKNDALVYDDYAHHPTEIKATLKTAREKFSNQKIIVIFQPHLYSRTKLLMNEFAQSFKDADEVIVAPVYAAREPEIEGVNSHVLAATTKKYHKNVHMIDTHKKIITHIQKHSKTGDIVFTMGAGNIYTVGESLAQ